MSRTITTFGLLQAAAAVLTIAIIFWSIGLPSLRFAQAANVTFFSNTLSNSAPTVASNHTITFVTPSGIANGETITLDFSDGPFVVGSVDHTDIEVFDDETALSIAADCTGSEETSAVWAGTTLTITFCAGEGASIPQNSTTTILIGTNANGGDAQLVNPGVGSYAINLTAGSNDVGQTRVAIVSPVTVTAAVDTTFTFTVSGLDPTDGDVNQSPIDATSTATSVPFGTLSAGNPVVVAQELTVATNAAYGFAVTAQVDQQLTSGTSVIEGFIEGTYTTTPTSWQSPVPVISDSNTWGHWGLTTDDATVALADPFDVGGVGELYVSASTSPITVFAHTGPADGSTQNIGLARVGYQAEITDLQPAGQYTATLTYVATPVF
jgi:hypothetical protein